MKADFCRDCVYSKTNNNKGFWIRICEKYNRTNIAYVDKCPMDYTQEDIDWIKEKEREDSKRGHILYGSIVHNVSEV